MGMPMLKRLENETSDEIARLLHQNKRPLEKLLEGKIDDAKIELLVAAVARACNGSERIKDILLLLHDKSFIDTKLTYWITKWPALYLFKDECESVVSTTVELLSQMLHLVPDVITSLGVALFVLKGVIKEFEQKDIFISPEVGSKLCKLTEKHSNYLRDSGEVTSRRGRRIPDNSSETPPDNFRDLPVLPTPIELRKDYEPFLRRNIVNGRYSDVNHYLDIHFRLLREDFVQPLREGIAEYTAEVAKRGAQAKKRYQNFRLYNNVRAVGIDPSKGGLLYILKFDVDNSLQRVKWELSKRLIFGSLICLSRDDFKTLIFGVVANRDPKQLKQGFLSVTFDIEPRQSQEIFSYSFKMAESSSYFEAYRHVLGCLQAIDTHNFPFTRYIISANREPHLPRYIKNDPDCTFNLATTATSWVNDEPDTSIRLSLSRQRHEASSQSAHLEEVCVSANTGWPSAELMGFDESQMIAYKAALQEEVCLIQGPPGTGKTYVGLKIVQTLLENKSVWGRNKPLLVVCYTNHALDQFLEGILEFQKTGIVRIGGRSVSEKIKDLNLNQVKRRCQKSGRWQYGMVMGEMTKCAKEIQKYKSIIDAVSKKPLKTEILEDVMTENQRESFQAYKNYCTTDVIVVWLCLSDERGWMIGANERVNDFREGNEYDYREHQGVEMEQVKDGEHDFEGEEENEMDDVEDEELERRFIDDEDDFLQSLGSLAEHTPENVTVSLPSHENEVIHDRSGWTTKVSKKSRKIDRVILKKLAEPDHMTQEEATNITDIWSLDERQRWRLYRFWVQIYIRKIHQKLRQLFVEYDRKAAILKELRVDDDFEALRNQDVIGITTTGAAKYNKLLRKVGPPIIVVEEAAEILEAHVITSLSEHTQHLILIGDHQQLRPNPTVFKLCKDYKLDVSLFERLMRNGIPCHRLSLQHRMRPEISHILKIHSDFYPGLLDHEMVNKYDNILGVSKNLYFIEHNIQEIHDEENKSRSNLHEARFLTSLCKYLLQQGYSPFQITILTAYKGQVFIFKQIMDKKTFEGVRVCPVDNFQGEENDIILLSFVRSNVEGNIGFLKVSNRICVALSRAKKGLYCIGNFTLMSQESKVWTAITSDLQKRNLIGPSLKLFCRNHPTRPLEVSASEDFKGAPDGGCQLPCTARLDCGHTCQMKCHPSDKEHRDILCKRPCERDVCGLQHPCPLLCFQQCHENCQELVQKLLPCSHKQWVQCFQKTGDVNCRSKCNRLLPCGHQCKNRCGQDCSTFCTKMILKTFHPCGHKSEVQCSEISCPEECKVLLKCEHRCQGTCGKCENGKYHLRCTQKCKRILLCGHTCNQMCSRSCPPCSRPCENRCRHNKCQKTCGESCAVCKEECKWICSHKVCYKACGDECDRGPCNLPCIKRLRCGHPCIGLCGERCPTLCRHCNKADVTTILFGYEDEPRARSVSQ